MWWNFVGYSKGEIVWVQKVWEEGDVCFGWFDVLEGLCLSVLLIFWKIDVE